MARTAILSFLKFKARFQCYNACVTLNTIIFKRRRILGDIYTQCGHIESIPVYLNEVAGEPIGTVEESPAIYGDAFVFKLPGDVCKIFSVDGYDVGVDYDFSDKQKKSGKDSITLNHILLIPKPKAAPYGKRGSQPPLET
jgi:hypothetical protein